MPRCAAGPSEIAARATQIASVGRRCKMCTCSHRPAHIGDSESVRNRMRFSCQPNGAHYGWMLHVDGHILGPPFHIDLFGNFSAHTVISMGFPVCPYSLRSPSIHNFHLPPRFRRRAWPAVQIDFMLGMNIFSALSRKSHPPPAFIYSHTASAERTTVNQFWKINQTLTFKYRPLWFGQYAA